MIITSLLTLLTTTFTGTLLAEDAAALSNRRVFVTYDVYENLSAGTQIARLLDHNLTLKNFRLAEPQNQPLFTIDAHDGSVCIGHDVQMDFESHRRLRCLVLADENRTEDDPFLQEFSAGLLEDGFTTGALRSLSTGTVTFDITILLRDVPEPPELLDANLVVQVLDDSNTAFGTVAAVNPLSSEAIKYFIASGNEDDFFQINPDTGTLSLRGHDARHFDMMSTHELVILAENSAGLSDTANVIVSVFNETPQPVSTSAAVTAQVSGQNSALEPSDAESVPSTAAGNEPEHFAMADTNPDSVIEEPAVPILNLDGIDMVEVGNWVTETTAADADSKSADVSTVTQTESTLSPPPAENTWTASREILWSVGALIVFVLACIAAAAIALSRASAARDAILEETSKLNEEKLEADALQLLKKESEPGPGSIPSETSAPESVATADQDWLISQLQDQLASRDQLIAQLQKELQAVRRDSDKQPYSGEDTDYGVSDDAWDDCGTSAAIDPQPKQTSVLLPQISQHCETETDARTSLMMARERLEEEFTRHTSTRPARNDDDAPEMSFASESSAAAVATLDEPEDLRSELSDLFEMQVIERPATVTQHSEVAADSATAKSDETDRKAEDSHLDSIKRYLSELLDRSADAMSPEEILIDRRKTDNQYRGADRRATPEPTHKPVKSFLDSYISTHGGEPAGVADTSTVPPLAEKADAPRPPMKPRTPVDVQSIRESMNSFRAVAIQSVENAVLTHDRRQAKGTVAVRKIMIAGLMAVTILVFLANMVKAIEFSMLNWLMLAAVLLATAELGLRIYSIRRQRKTRASAIPEPHSPKRPVRRSEDCKTLVE
ncbi:MAG: cadherin repeat domain-containing protein [Fuerstia sp.]|nr:cadherin repeat domain-containing protein [Fuerstiella sp.]